MEEDYLRSISGAQWAGTKCPIHFFLHRYQNVIDKQVICRYDRKHVLIEF